MPSFSSSCLLPVILLCDSSGSQLCLLPVLPAFRVSQGLTPYESSFSAYLPPVLTSQQTFLPGHKQGEQFEVKRCWQPPRSLLEARLSPPSSCSCTSPQAPQRLILPIRQPTIVRTARAASALSAAQDVGTARLPCTSGHSITSLCAADYTSKAHLKSLSPPVLVTFNTSSRFHAVHCRLSPNDCNLQKCHKQDKCCNLPPHPRSRHHCPERSNTQVKN